MTGPSGPGWGQATGFSFRAEPEPTGQAPVRPVEPELPTWMGQRARPPVPGEPPSSAPGAATAPVTEPSIPRPARPGAATAAAVLTLVQFGLLVVAGLLALVGGDVDVTSVGAWVGVLGVLALGALGVVGAISLLRGISRSIVLVLARMEVGLVAVGAIAAAIAFQAYGPAVVLMLGLGLLFVALPLTRAVLAGRPAVAAFVAETARSGAPRALPGSVVLGVVGGTVALVALVGIVSAAEGGGSLPAELGFSDAGPVSPPAVGDAEYLSQFDQPARACWLDDMSACDQLWAITPVGSYYESFGSTCGGRLSYEVAGGCVDELG